MQQNYGIFRVKIALLCLETESDRKYFTFYRLILNNSWFNTAESAENHVSIG